MLKVDTELKISNIHGLGLFTKQFIPSGTIVCRFQPSFDLRFDKHALDNLFASYDHKTLLNFGVSYLAHYGYLSDDEYWYLNSDNARFMNHSYNPNISTGYKVDYDISLVDIQPGTELTVNYYKFDLSANIKLKNV